jgi:excisionase family DNA binding protein
MSDTPSNLPVEDRFLTVSDVQRLLGVSRSTVWRWTTERGLKVIRVGGVTRIRESDLKSWLRRSEVLSSSPQAKPDHRQPDHVSATVAGIQ